MSGAQRMPNNNMLGHGVSNGVVGVGVGVGVAGVGVGGVNNLRDVCNFLQPAMNAAALPSGVSPYDHIITMMRGLDLQDDGIVMNHKIKSIETDFCHLVRDENMLCESMEYINERALADADTALKFALLFSSRNFDALAMNDTKVRSAMLKILETNFINADTYRIHDKERLYNSITLLGEYYHRVRLADHSPITILGESLLNLLIREVSQLDEINVKLAKLILSQITLNGDVMRAKHKEELTQLLFHIRRNLIEQPSLKSGVKALLLMTLDLYYSGFKNLGASLEAMYTKYLVQEDEDEGNNNMHQQQQASVSAMSPQQYQQQQQQQQVQSLQAANYSPQVASNDVHNSSYENGDADTAVNDSYESQPSTKKWSEQVCEDSLYESEFGNEYNGSAEPTISGNSGMSTGGGDSGVQDRLNSADQLNTKGGRYSDNGDSTSRNARRSQKPRNSPRPLKHQFNSVDGEDHLPQQIPQSQHQQSGEERDQSKPLPRWRATRFNRDGAEQQDGRPRNQHRRYSTSFDDDRQSVRSEGGSIRLYSINDRLRHSQEKIERSGSNYNSIANSNWDQQSQHDDRSERSYVSNYERGNYRRGGRHYNNRQSYDKPPRFQKNQQEQPQFQQQQHQRPHHKDNKIHSESWRRSRGGNGGNNQYPDENSYRSNGPESNSRSSSRARTLPRPSKSHFDGANSTSSYRRSQSPMQQQRSHNYNAGRYSSQSSLASEGSNTFDRRHNRNRNYGRRPHQRQQNDWKDTHSVHGQPEEESWDSKNDNSELVRNARQTTKYMNYLSSQK